MAPTTSTRRTLPPGSPHRSSSSSERSWPSDVPLSTTAALAALESAPITVVGRLVDASNATFYCELAPIPGPDAGTEPRTADTSESSGVSVHAVYKPIEGERPLADFPDGTLAYREVAAWLVSQASGLRIVPPTVLREGPFGLGMLQLWIDVDTEVDPLTLVFTRDARLRRMCLIDLVMNNADRKGGHLLPTLDGAILGCDHGICFSTEPKLRTVLWGWVGEPFDEVERAALGAIGEAIQGELGARLSELLSDAEVDATRRRLEGMIRLDRFPAPDRDRRVIPWPPF